MNQRSVGIMVVLVALATFLAAATITPWWWSRDTRSVVVYTALDAEYSTPLFRDFTRRTGIEVLPKFDTESTKTVGLAGALLAERHRPRADLFWNNEILHTLRLQRAGCLAVYRSPLGARFPTATQSSTSTWHAFAARARVLLVNRDLVPAGEAPRHVRDLADLRWRGRCGLAKPLFGTTATHAACLTAHWGAQPAADFWRRVRENQVQVLAGNRQVARAVAGGRLAWGLTDTDDAAVELAAGAPVEIVFPDQGPDEKGTLRIPNTLAIIRSGPHADAARQLVDFLLSVEVESRLAAGPSAQLPLGADAQPPAALQLPSDLHWWDADFAAAADAWEATVAMLREF